MTFYDFITNFAAELMPTGRAQSVAEYDKGSSAAAVTSGPSRLVITEAFGRPINMSARQYRSMINSRWGQWIGNQQILEQQSRDDELRSQLKRGRSDAGDNPRPGDKDQKLDSGNEDDGDGDGDDGDGTSEGQGGGRRRKKTRRKKSKYSKMKGGKKKTTKTKKKKAVKRKLHKGPRGGKYYISKGKKVYV